MARKPTDKQLFKMKNEWLGQFYEEVKSKDFYRAVFPEGSFEREGHPEDGKCNGVLTVIEGEKARNYIVFDELNMVDEVKGAEFAIMSPVGYYESWTCGLYVCGSFFQCPVFSGGCRLHSAGSEIGRASCRERV